MEDNHNPEKTAGAVRVVATGVSEGGVSSVLLAL